MAQGFLNSVDPLHPVSNLFRSEQGVYMFSCKLGYYGNHALLNDQSNYSIWDSYDLKNTYNTSSRDVAVYRPSPSVAPSPINQQHPS